MGLFGKKNDPRDGGGYERRNSLGPLEKRRVYIANDDDGELPEPTEGYSKKKKKRRTRNKGAKKDTPTGPVKGRAPKAKPHKARQKFTEHSNTFTFLPFKK